ncbi:MAG: alcohol dehydrogenase catalytic domain-containing protein [Steroidobacteraceae bacterium]
MKAMVCVAPGRPLQEQERTMPVPGPGQLLIEVAACGVCRTDLHLVDGELAGARPGVIPGHEIVGRVVARGPALPEGAPGPGARVGVPWLGSTCGHCAHCRAGRENLCDAARFTGLQLDGGYAEYALADARYCFPIPQGYADVAAAPLLCAGQIGYRALRMAGEALRIGLYGFGAAAHHGTGRARRGARGLRLHAARRSRGAGTRAAPRRELGGFDAARARRARCRDHLRAGRALVPTALAAVRKGGTVVCGGIHMSDIPSFPYALLWGERTLRSVANLTRRDGTEFMALAARVPLHAEVHEFALRDANLALERLRTGAFAGAAVLRTGRVAQGAAA